MATMKKLQYHPSFHHNNTNIWLKGYEKETKLSGQGESFAMSQETEDFTFRN